MNRILAWITPIDPSAHPEHPIYNPVDPGFGKPSPIDPGYGVRPPVDPGYGVPAPPPHVAHPIPPIVWPDPPKPPIEKPPDAPGGTPSHPINLPPAPPPDGFHWELAFHPVLGGWSWVLVQGNPPTPPPPGYNPPSGGSVPTPQPAR